ncbi:MAG: serine/threonine-protein kinase [Coleofasciculaceae cyanobacterium]
MSYCVNPQCLQPKNHNSSQYCQDCGAQLLLQGRYRVLDHLGTGGFGKTYEVEDGKRRKVLKILYLNRFHLQEQRDKAVELFKQEGLVLSQLRYPGIPKVEEDGYFTYLPQGSHDEPFHCLVMEKIDGVNLKQWLNRQNNQPITSELAFDWLQQLVKILSLLHPQYFHRDIKPSNIMLKPDGKLVLIDFGAVREVSETYLYKLQDKDVTMVGSEGYAAPEQATGEAVARSDFFALGRTFVYLFTGIDPDDLEEDRETGKLIWQNQVPHISQPLKDFIDWLMEPELGNRPQNTTEIQVRLEAISSVGVIEYFPPPPWPEPHVKMLYCINPKCKQRQNSDHLPSCQACGTSLLIKNRYRLIRPLRKLGTPGHAEIFEVEDEGVQAVQGERFKVLKVLKKNNNLTLVRLFQQEAETLKRLNHPGIPKVELSDDYFTIPLPRKKELHCLVMEKIHGENLEKWVEENGVISSEQASEWLKQILEILTHLHQQKYLHRDLKPSNIMLRPNGQLVLIDFGTLRQITETFLVRLGMKPKETGTGIVTAGYTAPEQINGRAVPQSDLYSLGRTFVHLLTGKHPLDLQEDPKTGKLIWRDEVEKISEQLALWLDYMMEPFPWQRPLSAAFILKCLDEGLPPPQGENSPTPSTPPWLLIVNFTLFSVLLVTGMLWLQGQQEQRKLSPQGVIRNLEFRI